MKLKFVYVLISGFSVLASLDFEKDQKGLALRGTSTRRTQTESQNESEICSRFQTTGWHEGTYVLSLDPTKAPNGKMWRWNECAQQCALNSQCQFWTLQLTGGRKCQLLRDRGIYRGTGGHVEGIKDQNCLVPMSSNQKRGLGMWRAHSCRALENHTAVSWWYSWQTTAGFYRGFCENHFAALANARNNLGKEFVPMLYDHVPARPFDEETEENLQNAKYLMTLNEPELETQANLTPREAAVMWSSIVSIAREYNLELVAPCGTMDRGRMWYRDWLSECRKIYGQPCYFDYTCLHAYYHPTPCNGIKAWACIGAQASNAMTTINGWYSEFGKPTWVTELGCNPWGGRPCDASRHEQTMRQLIPYLDSTDAVFRYAWFQANGFYLDFKESNTNKIIWEVSWGVSCPKRKLVGVVAPQQVQECVAKSHHTENCHSPLVISMEGRTCYCSTDACLNLQTTTPDMRTWREVGPRNSAELTPLGELYQMI